jgi:uncharacterized protein YbcI
MQEQFEQGAPPLEGEARVRARGEMAAAISNAVVRIFAEWVGRGPTRARTVITDNIITTVMQETLTKAEIRLVQEGGLDAVMQMRRTHQGMMRGELMDAVEEITGRPVVAFLSDHQANPDTAVEVFVLATEGDERRTTRTAHEIALDHGVASDVGEFES